MNADLNLLQRYHLHGDATAFAELMRAHADMVYATARRVTRDAALAEDVTQEVFLKLARAGHQAIQSVGAWLHHVTRQRACDAIRGRLVRQRYEPEAGAWHDTSREAPWTEVEPLVDEALDALPQDCRTVLVEHFLEQRTQVEMARSLGVSQATISRQIDAALHLLRAGLRAQGVICSAGLATLLTANAAHAAPPALVRSLHKIGLSGAGTGAGISGAALSSASLLTMTLTSKALLATGVAVAIAIPFEMTYRGSAPSAKASASAKPPPAQAATGFAPSNTKSKGSAPPAPSPPSERAEDPRHLARQWEQAMASVGDRELVLAHFQKLGGVIKQEYVDQDIANIVQRNHGGDQEALVQALRAKGQTFEQFRQERLEMMILAVMKSRATQHIKIADPKERAIAVQQAYEAWVAELRAKAGD